MGNWGYNPALVTKKQTPFRSGRDPPCTIHVWYLYLHLQQQSTIHVGKYTIGPWFYGIGYAEISGDSLSFKYSRIFVPKKPWKKKGTIYRMNNIIHLSESAGVCLPKKNCLLCGTLKAAKTNHVGKTSLTILKVLLLFP